MKRYPDLEVTVVSGTWHSLKGSGKGNNQNNDVYDSSLLIPPQMIPLDVGSVLPSIL